jgi:hypothetical protein
MGLLRASTDAEHHFERHVCRPHAVEIVGELVDNFVFVFVLVLNFKS